MIPPNITAATAVDVGALPAAITLDVTDAPTEVWYTYTGGVGLAAVAVYAWANAALTTYLPSISIWTGTPGSLVQYLSFAEGSADQRPIIIPVAEGVTYYLKIADNGPGSPTAAVLELSVIAGPTEAITNGVILVNDDAEGYPIAVLDDVDGHIRAFAPFPAGESAEQLPTGEMLWEATVGSAHLAQLANTDLSLGITVPGISGVGFESIRITSDRNTSFYVASNQGPVNPTLFYQVSPAGAVLNSWTLPGNAQYLHALAVSFDGSTLYYVKNTIIHCYDLIHSVALPDLVTLTNTNVVIDLLLLEDNTLLVVCEPSGSAEVLRYDLTGTLLNTYPFADPRVNHIARSLDDPTTFWTWTNLTNVAYPPQSRFSKILVADGSVITSWVVRHYETGIYLGTVPAAMGDAERLGPSTSCPFLVLRTAPTPPRAFATVATWVVLDVSAFNTLQITSASPAVATWVVAAATAAVIQPAAICPLDIRRVVWVPHVLTEPSILLYREDEQAINSYLRGWEVSLDQPPVAYTLSVMPARITRFAPQTSQVGTLDLLIYPIPDNLDADDNNELIISDDYGWILVWGALADLLAQEGPAQDLQRAAYCLQRWSDGCQIARVTCAALQVWLGATPQIPDALIDLDQANPEWMNESGAPDTALIAGWNLLAVAPPPDGVYPVTVDLIHTVPAPTSDSDTLQIPCELFDTILNYAAHVASFKQGAAQVMATQSGYTELVKMAMIYNERVRARATFADILGRQKMEREWAKRPRRATPPTPNLGTGGQEGSV